MKKKTTPEEHTQRPGESDQDFQERLREFASAQTVVVLKGILVSLGFTDKPAIKKADFVDQYVKFVVNSPLEI
jgi:hypothetical protein